MDCSGVSFFILIFLYWILDTGGRNNLFGLAISIDYVVVRMEGLVLLRVSLGGYRDILLFFVIKSGKYFF